MKFSINKKYEQIKPVTNKNSEEIKNYADNHFW